MSLKPQGKQWSLVAKEVSKVIVQDQGKMKNSATYPMEITKTQQEKIDKTKPNWIHQYKIVGFLTIQYRNVRQKEVRFVVAGHLENICILGCEKKIILWKWWKQQSLRIQFAFGRIQVRQSW